MAVRVDSKTTASTNSETYSVAFGAGADSDNTNPDTRGVRIGSSADKADRTVTIGAGAQVKGRTVDLDALVSRVDLSAKAHATAYSPIFLGVASAFADAYIDVYSNAAVKVSNGATQRTTITGVQGVDVQAHHSGTLAVTRDVDVLAVALIFPQEGHLRGTDSIVAEVNVDKGVLVTAGARVAGGGLTASPTGLHVALYVAAENGAVSRPEHHDGIWYDDDGEVRGGDVKWDADVIVLGGLDGAPYLVVGSDGKVKAANAVKLVNSSGALVSPVVGAAVTLDAAGAIQVADITNSGYADIVMKADNAIANQDYTGTPGDANASWPMFEFRDTIAEVTIVNYSAHKLKIGKIDVVNDLTGANPLVRLTPNAGASTGFKATATLEYDLRHAAVPSYVDVEQRASGAFELELTKLVNNPIGLTRLINLNGSIVASGTARVVAYLADLDAPNGSIGSSTARLQVDLVFSTTRAYIGGPGGRRPAHAADPRQRRHRPVPQPARRRPDRLDRRRADDRDRPPERGQRREPRAAHDRAPGGRDDDRRRRRAGAQRDLDLVGPQGARLALPRHRRHRQVEVRPQPHGARQHAARPGAVHLDELDRHRRPLPLRA